MLFYFCILNLLTLCYSNLLSKSPTTALGSSHAMEVHDVLKSYNVDLKSGLSTLTGEKCLEIYGKNALEEEPSKGIGALLMEHLNDRLVQLLLVVTIVSGVLAYQENDVHAYVEPLSIFAILVINSIVSTMQASSANESMRALQKMQPYNACVLRNGEWIDDFPAQLLVPGDIIQLRVGDRIPADCRICELLSTTLLVNEAPLTGESEQCLKDIDPVSIDSNIHERQCICFQGCTISGGSCIAMVISTGKGTEMGKISNGVQKAIINTYNTKTPLMLSLEKLGDQLSYAVISICGLMWMINIPRFQDAMFTSRKQGALHFAKAAIALGVAAIPEGLPAVITLCLSLSTFNMAKKNIFVRKLSSIETLGCTSVICTDKTGTLTANRMTVTNLLHFNNDDESSDFNFERYDISSSTIDLTKKSSDYENKSLRFMSLISSMCNDARIKTNQETFECIGDPTEGALLILSEKLWYYTSSSPLNYENPENNNNENYDKSKRFWQSSFNRIASLEFNRDRKSMSVLVKPKTEENSTDNLLSENMLLVKGAAEAIIDRSKYYLTPDGSKEIITPDIRQKLFDEVSNLQSKPLRVLGLAYHESDALKKYDLHDLESNEVRQNQYLSNSTTFVEIENDMILVGFCGIEDPVRAEVAPAITKCYEAGVRVIMITGDSKATAASIASRTGILSAEASNDKQQHVFTSKEFFSFSRVLQLDILKQGNKVFCRAEPTDKQLLIQMLNDLGHVVCMTGDGINDAPALQQANIGIAMGITGTEVAKGAADMVLADDNFATIVTAIEEGRTIYKNMQSFISFLLSTNIGEVFLVVLSNLLGLPEPLAPLHLLWVNLITDGPPAIALGFNPPDSAVMSENPRNPNEHLISITLARRYLITGIYVAIATTASYAWSFYDQGISFSLLRNWRQCVKHNNAILPEGTIINGDASTPTTILSELDNDSLLCQISGMTSHPQTFALTVLVCMELVKALSAVSLTQSLIAIPPWTNPHLIIGVFIPFLLHLLLLYCPMIRDTFSLSPLSLREWGMVGVFAFPILFLEEILKFIERRFV